MMETAPARVALESTLIAHGLPWPDNLETARGSEAAVRGAGAEPATIASGLRVEARVDTPAEAAELVRAHRRLGLPGAVVLAQPPPADLALPREAMESALGAALRRADERGIAGKAITPFLLDAIRE